MKHNQVDLDKIKKYINKFSKNNLNITYHDEEFKFPKLSFISTVFNKQNYLDLFIKSVQNQMLKEFELIIVDDFSNDNSIKIINNYLNKDNRIKLIKNKKNRGTFYSRINGVLYSKGEYIIWVDPDDIIIQNGFYNLYNYIKKYDISIVQFNAIIKKNNTIRIKYKNVYPNIIKQPFLSYIFYFNETNKKGCEINVALWDKLVKRKTALKAINFIGKGYSNKFIIVEDDVIILFSLFQKADSYRYIDETCYYYIRDNNDSISNTYNNTKICGLVLHCIFINIRFLYEKSSKTKLGKLYCIYKLKQTFIRYNICFSKPHQKKEYSYINPILKSLLKSSYLSKSDKMIISILASLYNLN